MQTYTTLRERYPFAALTPSTLTLTPKHALSPVFKTHQVLKPCFRTFRLTSLLWKAQAGYILYSARGSWKLIAPLLGDG